jgi:uncharacterized spore protein YtfJ
VSTTTHEGTELADVLLQRIAQAVGGKATAATIFGEPVEREGVTVIPVAKARFGFGGGGGGGTHGNDEGSGGGGGGGALVSPVGYIEVHDGTAQFNRITSPLEVAAVVGAGSLLAVVLGRLLMAAQRR